MKWSAIILKAAGALLAILILYVLSFGPVYGYILNFEAFRKIQLANTVYAPVLALSQQNRTVESLAAEYASFFESVFSSIEARHAMPDPSKSP